MNGRTEDRRAVSKRISITPSSFFSNAAATEHGFTDEFWYRVFGLYLEAVARDPDPSFDKHEVERTIRVPFREGHVDVLVRCQPEPREFGVLRFTVFPASDGDGVREIPRRYMRDASRPVLGEGALLDAYNRW